MTESAPLPTLVYLGPVGTYSHQIAYSTFGDRVAYAPRETIAEVFAAVGDAPLALVPQENSIFGPVAETCALLRGDALGARTWVRGAVSLPVQHCLLVREGVALGDVRRVLSHEQALGQCGQFIARHLPRAEVVKVPSTAGAAETIAKDDEHVRSAAICSDFVVNIYPNLEVLHRGIQDQSVNHTRFYILSSDPTVLAAEPKVQDGRRYALFHVRVGPCGLPSQADILIALGLPPTRVHASQDIPLHTTYLIEVSNVKATQAVDAAGRIDDERWAEEVAQAAKRVTEAGGTVRVLGWW